VIGIVGVEPLRAIADKLEQALMVRSIALAAVLGVLVATGAGYAVSQPAWRSVIAMWFGATERAAETTLAREDWPICTTIGSMGSEADWAQLDPDFADGKRALAAGDWNAAITALKLAAVRDPGNADIENYIGYGYRRLRQLGPAMQHYQQALTFNRRHRSAHEHLGELYLVLGEPAKAEEQLAALENICLIPCEEFGDLQRAIIAYKGSSATR
jgi:tetratricopeptide (TPR) repeat protein